MSTVKELPIVEGSTKKVDPFAGLLGVDEMFRHVHAENFYKPFGDKMKEMFGDKKLPNGENIISVLKIVYDLGVQAGIATEKLEQSRIKNRGG